MRIACLATQLFEDSELQEPKKALEAAGHEVVIVAPRKEELRGLHGRASVKPHAAIDEVTPEEFDALFIPGGFSPDQLRADDRFVKFVKRFAALDRPIMAICHGPQLLFTAGVLEGRRVTAWKTVQGDLRRAGIDVVDEEVVRDERLVTSRQPTDLPAFNEAIVEMLAEEHEPFGLAGEPATEATAPTVH